MLKCNDFIYFSLFACLFGFIVVFFSSVRNCCAKRDNNSVVELYPGTISLLICSTRALPLSLFLSAMCPLQGAEEVDSFRMHGCEMKIQHPFTCCETHGRLRFVCICVKNTHATAQDSLSQSLSWRWEWAFHSLCVCWLFVKMKVWLCICARACLCSS